MNSGISVPEGNGYCHRNYFFYADVNYRSFGVLLWEIVTYGRTPLGDTSVEDIIDAAQNKTLDHERYMKYKYYYDHALNNGHLWVCLQVQSASNRDHRSFQCSSIGFLCVHKTNFVSP